MNPERAVEPRINADGRGSAGPCAFDQKDEFYLKITATKDKVSSLEFLASNGRSDSIEAPSNLHGWQAVGFRVTGVDSAGGQPRDSDAETNGRQVRAEAPVQEEGAHFKFFRLMLK